MLQHAFTESKKNCPEIHQIYNNPTFPEAIARLMTRYADKYCAENKKTVLANQWAAPVEFTRAMHRGLGVATERFASPLDFNPIFSNYYSMYAEDRLWRRS